MSNNIDNFNTERNGTIAGNYKPMTCLPTVNSIKEIY